MIWIRFRPRRSAPMVLAVAALALAAGCSKSSPPTGSSPPTAAARPSTPATVTIQSPANGQVFHGTSVTVPVRIELTGAAITSTTTTDIRPDQGHIHLYLDGQIVSMNFSLASKLEKVKPGQHILRAEFVAADHGPFDPRDFTQVTFEVQS